MADGPGEIEPLSPTATTAISGAQGVVAAYLRRYHRHEIDGHLEAPEEQVLFVANHGFGGLFDLNVAAVMATGHVLGVDRPLTSLVHQIAWTLGLGPVIEPLGMRPASREAAEDGFAKGHHVLVMPGGDLDAFKSHRDRNKVVFSGRSGFAKLAVDAGVPIVPVVTSGAGNTLFVISDGRGIAKALRLDRILRTKAFPVSLSFPWGLNVGLVGLLPYIPLPAKLRTRVLEPMRPLRGENIEEFARRVEAAMQQALDELARK